MHFEREHTAGGAGSRFVRGVGGVILAAVLAISRPGLPAFQSQSQPPVFRSTTNLVEVDVIVRDRRDNFVLGLTADDLELYEDGKPQKIQQLFLVTTDPKTGLSSRAGETSNPTDLRSHRVFILLFDEGDLETVALQRVKKGAEEFLTQQFREGDYGAVVVGGRLYQEKLTSSKVTLLAGVRAVRPAFDSRQSRLQPFREFPRIPGEAEAVRIVAGDRFLLNNLGRQACGEDPFACSQGGGLEQIENKLQLKARLYLAQARDATRYTLDAFRTVADVLAPLPGRKTVVFFSDGLFVEESRSLLQQIAGQAARVGATIYSIDGRGLNSARPPAPDVTTPDRPIDSAIDTSQDGPTMLADGTGGLVIRNTENIGAALERIANDTGTYYIVGYQPLNAQMDGKFRSINVKTRVSGLTVRARQGYVASRLPPR